MARSEKEFKWFGEGFDGFPVTLPEDSVEYSVFYLEAKADRITQRSKLLEVAKASQKLAKSLLKDYIWQRDTFELTLTNENELLFLKGTTNFGDSIEDEWVIVYLLRELSKQFPSIWIKLVDNDGQFLLIEGAAALPKWITPENSSNRLWMNVGKLLIIPLSDLERTGNAESQDISHLEAVKCIRENRARLLHLPEIESAAFEHLHKYPDQITLNHHHALIRIPRKLAYVLSESPTSISPASEAFYLRDPVALRPLLRPDNEKLVFQPRDLVTARIKFTRVGYAQVRSQDFNPPPAWSRAIPSNDPQWLEESLTVGMKITSGFEMLTTDPQNQDKKSVRELKVALDELENGEANLPTDEKITTWGASADDTKWLDINYQDFEAELAGKSAKSGSAKEEKKPGLSGDQSAQENLRNMVSRFEAFLNDENAGDEGTEFSEDSDGNDEDVELNSDDDSSERSGGSLLGDVSFNESEFMSLMQDMMGQSLEPRGLNKSSTKSEQRPSIKPPNVMEGEEIQSVREIEDDSEEITNLSKAMEAELRGLGALKLNSDDPKPQKKSIKAAKEPEDEEEETENIDVEDENAELDIDHNLVKSMLESFKSQAGMAGPGGNLMGMMGMKLPRDEGDEHEQWPRP